VCDARQVVLITGGAKRVGAAICRRLHAAGANLMLHYRASAGEARLLQAELNGSAPTRSR
jgi:pteridine reductase